MDKCVKVLDVLENDESSFDLAMFVLEKGQGPFSKELKEDLEKQSAPIITEE